MINPGIHPGPVLHEIREEAQLEARPAFLHAASSFGQSCLCRHPGHDFLLDPVDLIRDCS